MRFKKLHQNTKTPTKGTEDAGCYDLCYSRSTPYTLPPYCSEIVPVGVAVEIPKGYRGILSARSSQSKNRILVLPGIIDADYRGDISPRLLNLGTKDYTILPGDKIAQFHIEKIEEIDWVEREELTETVRGSKGFGSTGR